jgi:hypothetical protein
VSPDRLIRLAALAAAVLLAAGCATTRITNEWRDAQQPLPTLRGDRVLVFCRAFDETARRVCEEEWGRQLAAAGAQPVLSFSQPGFPVNAGDLSTEMREAAIRARAVAITSTTVQATGSAPTWGYGPQVGVGVGASGGSGGGGSFGFGGVSISLPVGGGMPAGPSLAYNTAVVDVGSGRLAWSANASAPSSSDQRAQLADLTRITVDAMRKAGLL